MSNDQQPTDQIQSWYFSFGSGHTHPITGEDLSNAYVVIEGTWASTRAAMFASVFQRRWSHQYETADAIGVDQFDLRQIEMPKPAEEPAESNVWSCPEPDCGYHIADGPIPDGDAPTDQLIAEHQEEHELDRERDMAGHADCDNAGKPVKCDRCGAEYICTPSSDYYCTPQGDHSCEACLVGDREVITISSLDDLVDERGEAEQDPQRVAYTQGLREIADWLDAHPEVELPYLAASAGGQLRPAVLTIMLGSWTPDQRGQMAAVGRAMGRFAKFTKPDSERFEIYREFAGITLVARADRDEVCERIVIGSHEVTEEVPDPEALAAVPKVTVTRTVEDVEWRCGPLLAPVEDAAVKL